MFGATFAKVILVLSNPDSITKFEFRSFMTRLNFFGQISIISLNYCLNYCICQVTYSKTKIRFAIIRCQFLKGFINL